MNGEPDAIEVESVARHLDQPVPQFNLTITSKPGPTLVDGTSVNGQPAGAHHVGLKIEFTLEVKQPSNSSRDELRLELRHGKNTSA